MYMPHGIHHNKWQYGYFYYSWQFYCQRLERNVYELVYAIQFSDTMVSYTASSMSITKCAAHQSARKNFFLEKLPSSSETENMRKIW